MTRYRIILGPVSVCVERNGIRSDIAPLDETHSAAEIRQIAGTLYRSIVRIVAFEGWVRHRRRMAFERARFRQWFKISHIV